MGIISRIIGYPLGWIMWLFYHLCNNYALAIVLFTIVTKLIMIPTQIKTQKSTVVMQSLQPKLDKLKKQYGKNQEKYNEEVMKLYAEEDCNPMGSCLPMLIQFPILYGIFDVVYRPITHILRIKDDIIKAATEILADTPIATGNSYFSVRPEIYITQAIKNPEYIGLFSDPKFDELKSKVLEFNNTFLGVDLDLTPTFKPEVWNSAAIILLLIPIMSGVFQMASSVYSQIRQKKMNPSAMQGPQAGSMMLLTFGMPIFAVWIAYKYPAAIGFYWAASAFFSFISMIIINKIYTPEYVQKLVEKDKLKKKNQKKKGMMERYQQLMQEQMAAQNGGRTATSRVSDDDDEGEVKLSKSQQREYERRLINEARKRQAEKYGDEYYEDDDNDQ